MKDKGGEEVEPRCYTSSFVGHECPIKIGINGFGRIGRQVLRIVMERTDMVVTHINACMPPEYLAYLLRYDTVHGRFRGSIKVIHPTEAADTETNDSSRERKPRETMSAAAVGLDEQRAGESGEFGALVVNGHLILLSQHRDPYLIPWKNSGVRYVCESTGAFLTTEECFQHINRPSGCAKVIISAPARDEVTPTLVVGVNAAQEYNPLETHVVSCASCTTNGLAPLAKVIEEEFGIEEGLMTTIHAVTKSQPVLDGGTSPKDWRGGRSGLFNIIPSSTGAAKAVAKCIPSLKGRLTGMAFRVPTADVSVVDLTCRLKTPTSIDEIRQVVRNAANTSLKGILGYTQDAVVSGDYVGEVESCIFDSNASTGVSDRMFKLICWYDNEWGYSVRLVDLIHIMAELDGMLENQKQPQLVHLPIYNMPHSLLPLFLYQIQDQARKQQLYRYSQKLPTLSLGAQLVVPQQPDNNAPSSPSPAVSPDEEHAVMEAVPFLQLHETDLTEGVKDGRKDSVSSGSLRLSRLSLNPSLSIHTSLQPDANIVGPTSAPSEHHDYDYDD
eukprot:GHVS01085682.1.p1 GENE.GHVS01085682.1~~GHVS01085682.1.p1  ORF type:complete len:556 (+),score=81.64 GHVS01085682.1:88-1755(+)